LEVRNVPRKIKYEHKLSPTDKKQEEKVPEDYIHNSSFLQIELQKNPIIEKFNEKYDKVDF